MASLLILGGTGLMGSAIVRESKKNNTRFYNNTIALSRTADQQKPVDGVKFVKGNALEPSTLNEAFESNPNVVHTVGTLIEQSKYGQDGTFDRLNRDAALAVADKMAEKYDGSRKCFVYFSAANAPPKYLLNERYILAKREAEAALLGRYNDKLRVVVLRPGLIYSYHRRQLLLPLALGLIIGAAILKPLTSYVPNEALYFTDRPLLDAEITHAVFEALEDDKVEGVYEIEGIRALAKAWETKQLKKA